MEEEMNIGLAYYLDYNILRTPYVYVLKRYYKYYKIIDTAI
jgi:hypothetical protein